MLNLEQVNFLIELCAVQGVSVPIKSARLAAETFEALQQMQSDLAPESTEPTPIDAAVRRSLKPRGKTP